MTATRRVGRKVETRCPSWCEQPSGHAYGTPDVMGDAERVHLVTISEDVTVEQIETLTSEGEVLLDFAEVHRTTFDPSPMMTAQVAGELAMALFVAAERVRKINAT